MELFDPKRLNFTWTNGFKKAVIASLVLTLASVAIMVYPGINYGIDFRGGIEARVTFADKNVGIGQLREVLDPKLQNVSVVAFGSETGANPGLGNEFSITAQSASTDSVATQLRGALTSAFGAESDTTWKVQKLDEVGAKVGADFRKSALLSLIYTCLLIVLYMYWRFDIRYTPGVLACVFHDLIVATGFIIAMRMEFSTTLVAALLTLAGYSVNDTVVVFDRIRELEAKHIGRDAKAIVNEAINSTLSRTLMTSVTTLMGCVTLYFFGGSTLEDLALVLIVGIIVGTYSSVYVATPLYVWADKKFGRHTGQPTTSNKPMTNQV